MYDDDDDDDDDDGSEWASRLGGQVRNSFLTRVRTKEIP